MDIMKIYNKLPVWGQNLACTIEGYRVHEKKYGKRVQRELPAMMERNTWNYSQLCAYRDEQLRIMIRHCYEHVPYYYDLFNKLGINYNDIQCLDDLKILPIMNKTTVRENAELLMADNIKKSVLLPMHTSGTTGSGLQFYFTKDAFAIEWADEIRNFCNLGLNGNERAAYFGGRQIVPRALDNPPFYRINYAMKEAIFSAYHLKYKNLKYYVEGLEKMRPLMWHGYPSFIITLAQYILDNDIKLSFVPKCILLTSENVSKSSVDKMELAFGCRPVVNYAQTEQVATFHQLNDGKIKVVEDYTAVEFVPRSEGDTVCKIVGTSLYNYAMPFLRYDTGDLATYRETDEGREVIKIDGRQEDIVKLKDGTVLGRLDHLFKDQINIVEAQIIQHSIECVEFLIVQGKNYSLKDELELKKIIDEFFLYRIDYKITYVKNIEKTENGKLRLVISKV